METLKQAHLYNHILFKPIVSLKSGYLIGYLAEPREINQTPFLAPLETIEGFIMQHKLLDIGGKKEMLHLFVKISHQVLLNSILMGKIVELLNNNPIIDRHHLTFILHYESSELFSAAVKAAKVGGFQIGLDEHVLFYGGEQALASLEVSSIHLSRQLCHQLHESHFKQMLAHSFVDFCIKRSIMLYADGIDQKDDLKTAIDSGLFAASGNFIEKPVLGFVQKIVHSFAQNEASQYRIQLETYSYIGKLAELLPAIDSDLRLEDARQMFPDYKAEGLCVTKDELPIGLLIQQQMLSKLSTPYGNSLYAGRSISKLMDTAPLMVDYDRPVSVVGDLAMSRHIDQVYDPIIVIKEDKYYGIVSVKKILQYLTYIEKNDLKKVANV